MQWFILIRTRASITLPRTFWEKKYPADFDESSLKAQTVAEALQKGHKADKACVDMGYFKQRSTLNDRIMITIGLAEKQPTRWNADGSWNW
jgi:hypothetical protein